MPFLRRPTFASHSSATSSQPFPHFADFNIRTPGGAYFLLFWDTFKSAAANSLRIDNAKRISYQWGGGEPISCRKRTRVRSTRTKKKERAVFLLETYRAAIPFQFWGQDESKERQQSEMNINDYLPPHFSFMEMIGYGYSGISNLLVVYILEFP